MTEKPLGPAFLADVNAFLERTRLAPTDFGKMAVNDPNFVIALRGGRSNTLNTVDKVRKFMAEYPQATAAE